LRSAEENETDPADRLHEVTSMLKLDHETILLAFAVVTGLAMLLQTIMLLAITVALRKAANAVREEAENLRTSVMPVIYDTRDLVANTQIMLTSAQEFVSSAQGVLNRMGPKIEAATGDLAEIALGLRVQTAEIQTTAMEILNKVRKQGNRLDEMCTGLLDTVDRAGGFVANAVSAPVRQVSRILGTVKAVVESLSKPVARS
jgi:DNA anti-recombination protein RmuC